MKFSLALSALLAVHVAESSLLRADVDLNRELTYQDCVSVEEPILETDPLVNRIFDIQSGGNVSPFYGSMVNNVPGIVTLSEPTFVIIQDQEGDNDDSTSDAIQVIGILGHTLEVGDVIVVKEGYVEEGVSPIAMLSQPRTAINARTASNLEIVSRGNALPKPVIIGANGRLPPAKNVEEGQRFFESLKVMLVKVESPVAISPTLENIVNTVGDNGQYATGLSQRGTMNVSPHDWQPEIIPLINIDDNTAPVDVGGKFDDVEGHLFQTTVGTYALFASEHFGRTADSTLEPTTATCKKTPLVMLTGTYNIDGSTDYVTLADHLVKNMGYPDVVGLQGVTPAVNLTLLVDAVQALTTEEDDYMYTFIPSADGTPILYNWHRVAWYDTTISEKGNSTNPAIPYHLAAKLKFIPLGEKFDLINVLFTPKDVQSSLRMGVNQPFEDLQEVDIVNVGVAARRVEANTVRSLIDGETPFVTDPEKVIVLGAMFENEFVSPIKTLEGTPLKNLAEDIRNRERYSLVDYDGVAQAWDYIMVSEEFCLGSTGEYIRVNAEFYEGGFFDPMVGCIKMPYVDDDNSYAGGSRD